MIVQSLGTLAELPADWMPRATRGALQLAADYTADYQAIYRTQPNVRTTVDFLARNVAQLGLHAFRRVSDTDRQRLTDHPLTDMIARPNPSTTRYRMIDTTLIDYAVYWNAYWLKLKDSEGRQLVYRIPPWCVSIKGGIVPTGYVVTWQGRRLELEPHQLVHFRGYGDTLGGLSPLETLRRVLAEEYQAGEYRSGLWKNAARMSGILERPASAPPWSDPARDRFLAEFADLHNGSGNSGRTAILEDGMTYKPNSFSARDSEYLAGRKLTREEVARAYHVPLSMIGIMDGSNYANIQDQHRSLYQDCLGPWLVQIAEEIELQLLPDFADVDGVYLEFNIAEKLKGSFEEQAAALSTSVGRPWMTADEARARQNLPGLGGDAGALVTPLNVLVGGQASPRDSAPPKARGLKAAGDDDVDELHVRLHGRHVTKWTEVLTAFFRRQRDVVLSKYPAAKARGKAAVTLPELFDAARWAGEMADDLLQLNYATASVFAERVVDALGPIPDPNGGEDVAATFDSSEMVPYLTENARIAAERITETTEAELSAALRTDDPLDGIRRLFDVATTSRASQIAVTKVTQMAGFGSNRGAEAGGARNKVWRVNSRNPRSQHSAVAGQTVRMGSLFGNGMKWPGDYTAGADNVAGCQCSLAFNRDTSEG